MFNVHLYDYSSFDFGLEIELDLYSSVAKFGKFDISFDFGLEIELDLYSSVAKFGKFDILDMRLAKTQFGQSICSF